mgnify:CR=1 FL=1
MDRIPLINPKLIKVVAANADNRPTPVLQAEVVSSEPIKESKDQQYKVILKIGQQQLETISPENLKKGTQLEVKITPGPALKIINNQQSHTPPAANNQPSSSQTAAQSALQQLLADRIPKIHAQELPKLIEQLSQLVTGSKALLLKTDEMTTGIKNTNLDAQPILKHSNQQALANLAYKSLAGSLGQNTKTSTTIASQASANTQTANKESIAIPLQQVKNWLQQLPNSDDISQSMGLRNALNNTGARAETQLSQLAQQFLILNQKTESPLEKQNANSLFQQLQKIQQKMLSSSPDPSAKTDLASLVKNTAQTLANNTQKILSDLKMSPLTKAASQADPKALTTTLTTAATSTAKLSPLSNPVASSIPSPLQNPLPSSPSSPTGSTSNWQNPLLNNQAYSTINELLQDPLLQNPSSNTKFALSQLLTTQGEQGNSHVQIPLNWPERGGNDAILFRTLQNLLGHIEREQGLQMQQADSNLANTPQSATTQNQQWLPLLINHQQQLQLIEFYIDKEEKKNGQGEKKNHWFINLHFDLPQLGKLGIEISMFENECNTTFWSESSSTLNQLSQHIKPLRQRLTEQGIVVADVQSRHGTLARRKHNIQQRLVDIET